MSGSEDEETYVEFNMRIPPHRHQHYQHQGSVAFIQQTNNNDIVNHHNILPNSNSTILSSSLLTSAISSTGTATITTPTSAINNYTRQFEDTNENGNGNGNGNDSTIESFTTTTTAKTAHSAIIPSTQQGLINRNDNVNLLLSTTTAATTNHNQSQKYPSVNPNRYQNFQLSNLNCSNLNKSTENWNCTTNKSTLDLSRSTEVTGSRKTDEEHFNNLNLLQSQSLSTNIKTANTIRIQNCFGNNGNNNDIDDGTRISNTQDIYEGNLNVLVAEEDATDTNNEIVTPALKFLRKSQQNHVNSNSQSFKDTSNRNEASKQEYINKNLKSNLGQDPDENYDDEEDNNDVDFDDAEVVNIAITHDILGNQNDIKVDNINKDIVPIHQTQLGDADDIEITPLKFQQHLISSHTKETTGAFCVEYQNLNSHQITTSCDEGQKNITNELAELSLAKKELEKNFKVRYGQSCGTDTNGEDIQLLTSSEHWQQQEQEHQHLPKQDEQEEQCHILMQGCHQRTSHHRNRGSRQRESNYQRHQDNSLSSNSAESSPDDSLMDDDDIFSETPSSCTSLDSPEPGRYPRGIINPNYPGFQHLAHTLSEHFVNHHLDQDDSDLSEFEVELSVESLDESYSSYSRHDSSNLLNSSPNNNNQDTNSVDNIEHDDEPNIEHPLIGSMQEELSEILDYNLGSTVAKVIHQKDITTEPEKQKHTTISNCTRIQEIPCTGTVLSLYSGELCCDLDTYLKKFETLTDIKMLETPNIVEDATRNCPTPDILIKNDKKSCRKKNSSTLSVENRPDLLRNVSPNPEVGFLEEKKPRISVPDNIEIEPKRLGSDKQDDLNSFSMTPVDIIGDFGREVEHEFGLIVSGYSSNMIGKSTISPDDRCDGTRITSFDKMTDAVLSECKDALIVSTTSLSLSEQSLNHVAGTYGCTTCDLVKTTTPLASSPLTDDVPHMRVLENASVSCKQSPTVGNVEESNLEIPSVPSSFPMRSRNSADQAKDDRESLPQPPTTELMIQNSAEKSILNESQDTTTPASPTTQEPCPEAPLIVASDDLGSVSCRSSDTFCADSKVIPTAVIKPKYQKPSYDERQLPPIGWAYSSDNASSRAWCVSKPSRNNLHPPTAAATVVANANLVQISETRSRKTNQFSGQSNRERTVKNPKKSIGRVSSSLLTRAEKLSLGGGIVRKDTSVVTKASCIAIVNPRKKDKMENYVSFGGSVGADSGGERGCVGENREKRGAMSASAERNVVFEKNNNNNNNIKCKKSSFNNNRKERAASSASFDVYNIETALPVIDLEAIEKHLKKAKEEEKKRRNDREEIRRRLAMGAEDDYFSKLVNQDRPGRKPSLQSRLQNGMNLQICFMNEASSDTESPSSDSETCPKLSKSTSNSSTISSRYSNLSLMSSSSTDRHPYNTRPLSINRPSTLSLGPPTAVINEDVEVDFFTKQARLQIEARMALAQAKDMAHMQMEIERQKLKGSPITEVIRNSMEKVGVPFPPEKRRVSRQMLTDMNIAQLQIIVNDLHTQIERLNEQLVQYLMERDDLHMGQDSMLVDIEDLTRYLGAKEQSKLNGKTSSQINETPNDYINENHQQETTKNINNNLNNNNKTSLQNGGVQSHNKFLRIANLVKK